eukprot:6458290-Amphidinium_carterae.1
MVADSTYASQQLHQALSGRAAPQLRAGSADARLEHWTTCWKGELLAVAGLPAHTLPRLHVAKPVEKSFTMGRRTSSLWLNRLTRYVGRLHTLLRMRHREGFEATRLWARIQQQLPPFLNRYGPPTLDFEHPGEDLEAWSTCVLRATYEHFAACLNSELVQARQSVEQHYRQRILANHCINKTVAKRLRACAGPGACSLVVHGSRTFLPTELFPAITSYWRPIMEAQDPGCPQRLLDHVVATIREGHWMLPPITAEGLKSILKDANKHSAPGPDNWHYDELGVLPMAALRQLAELYGQIEADASWPSLLTTSWTALLPKTELPLDAKDLRPIRVLPTLFRLWSALRLRHLLPHLQAIMPPCICAYLPGRDMKLAVTHFVEDLGLRYQTGKPTYGMSLDASKAFPSVRRSCLKQIALRAGLSAQFWRTLEAHYEVSTTCWRLSGQW